MCLWCSRILESPHPITYMQANNYPTFSCVWKIFGSSPLRKIDLQIFVFCQFISTIHKMFPLPQVDHQPWGLRNSWVSNFKESIISPNGKQETKFMALIASALCLFVLSLACWLWLQRQRGHAGLTVQLVLVGVHVGEAHVAAELFPVLSGPGGARAWKAERFKDLL